MRLTPVLESERVDMKGIHWFGKTLTSSAFARSASNTAQLGISSSTLSSGTSATSAPAGITAINVLGDCANSGPDKLGSGAASGGVATAGEGTLTVGATPFFDADGGPLEAAAVRQRCRQRPSREGQKSVWPTGRWQRLDPRAARVRRAAEGCVALSGSGLPQLPQKLAPDGGTPE